MVVRRELPLPDDNELRRPGDYRSREPSHQFCPRFLRLPTSAVPGLQPRFASRNRLILACPFVQRRSGISRSSEITRKFEGGWFASTGYIWSENSSPDAGFTPLVPDSDLPWRAFSLVIHFRSAINRSRNRRRAMFESAFRHTAPTFHSASRSRSECIRSPSKFAVQSDVGTKATPRPARTNASAVVNSVTSWTILG